MQASRRALVHVDRLWCMLRASTVRAGARHRQLRCTCSHVKNWKRSYARKLARATHRRSQYTRQGHTMPLKGGTIAFTHKCIGKGCSLVASGRVKLGVAANAVSQTLSLCFSPVNSRLRVLHRDKPGPDTLYSRYAHGGGTKGAVQGRTSATKAGVGRSR